MSRSVRRPGDAHSSVAVSSRSLERERVLRALDSMTAEDRLVLALQLVDGLAVEPSLRSYHLLPSVRGDLLSKLGRRDEARVEFERAASLTRNERERTLLQRRASVQ